MLYTKRLRAMLNRNKRHPVHDIDQLIEELEKNLTPEPSYERIFLTILYEIQDIKESIDNIYDAMTGYDQ